MKIYHVRLCGILIASFLDLNQLINFVGSKYDVYWYSEGEIGVPDPKPITWQKLLAKAKATGVEYPEHK